METSAVEATLPGLNSLGGSTVTLLRFLLNPIAHLFKMHQRFGLIGAMSKGESSLIFAFSPEYNQQVLNDPGTYYNYSTLPFKIPDDAAFHRNINGLVTMNGAAHQRYRRLLNPAVSKTSLEAYATDMARITDEYVQQWQPDTTVYILEEMRRLTLLIALKCLFGLESGNEGFNIGELSTRSQKYMFSPTTLLFPFDMPGTTFRKYMLNENELERQLLNLIQRKRNNPSVGKDMLSILINTKDDDGNTLTDHELQGHTLTLLVAGHETAANTLSWIFFLLAQHPDIYQAVLEELDSVLHGSVPTPQQLSELTLLDRVVKESMRLMPALPLLLFRQPQVDVQLGGYHIPKGSLVVISPMITHRLSNLYENPNDFQPERWSHIKPSAFEYLPFSAGPRLCLGIGFASQEIRIVLATLLQRFKFHLEPNLAVNYQMQSLILGPKGGLPMRLRKSGDPIGQALPVRGNIHRLVNLT